MKLMPSNNVKWAFNLFRSLSITFKQSSLIFYGGQEILPHCYLDVQLGLHSFFLKKLWFYRIFFHSPPYSGS